MWIEDPNQIGCLLAAQIIIRHVRTGQQDGLDNLVWVTCCSSRNLLLNLPWDRSVQPGGLDDGLGWQVFGLWIMNSGPCHSYFQVYKILYKNLNLVKKRAHLAWKGERFWAILLYSRFQWSGYIAKGLRASSSKFLHSSRASIMAWSSILPTS